MKTAFIILTYNRSDALLAVLRALAPQCNQQHEVILVDDGSVAAQVEALKNGLPAFSCPVRRIWHPDTGFTAARARNKGAAHSRSEYLVFLDGDCVPTPHFVRMHEALAQRGCFVNGSRVLLSRPLTERVIAGEVDVNSLSWAAVLGMCMRGDINKLTHRAQWPGAPGRIRSSFRWKGIRSCNFGVWRSDFEAVDGFDESFRGWGHEDADLVLRLHNHGAHRKDGYLATEVLHLWHPENTREREATNRQRVLERLESGIIPAEAGMSRTLHATDTVATELNRTWGNEAA